jgi:hypothetical protein
MTFSFAKDEHLIYASVMGSRENGGATGKDNVGPFKNGQALALLNPLLNLKMQLL